MPSLMFSRGMIGTVARIVALALSGSVTSAHASESPTPAIPLCKGLTIVTAIDDPKGDYESIKQITNVTADAVQLTVNGDRPTPLGVRTITVARTVRRDDLKAATFYLHIFDPGAPISVPGSTALGTSAAVLAALKANGGTNLSVVDPSARAAPAEQMRRSLWRYPLTRVGPAVVPVTVNGAKVDLPALHARGSYLGDRAEFFFLDDERNPLALRYAFSSGVQTDDAMRLQVVRISFNCSSTPAVESRLERSLRESGRADVYEIYFEFNSDRLRQQSEPTLREIAAVMAHHPEWTLGIEGHTDGVGSDAANLELSRRRSAAVKNELITRFSVNAPRLTTAGFGESRPKDRNDTLEGRARNRRVELVRLP
jgi:outer membrane protein OmpA-like peptidoglycan-associated protein